MHTVLFLEPGHFHAALTLRVSHPRLADEIVVYAQEGSELRDFLTLVDRFNHRPEHPTRWRPLVVTGGDSLARLVADRRGDIVVLAGRNGGKAHTIRRLHEAGLHVLADKPWLVHRDDLAHVRASLDDWPLVMEIMTGRHDVTARVLKRLVDTPDVFGHFLSGRPAIELESVHHLDKLVDGAPLRRPWWFFDVRAQGSGVVDIPTHLVDQTQWLLDTSRRAPGEMPQLRSARAWTTAVPADAFCRITGQAAFPVDLQPSVEGNALNYLGNAELDYRIGDVIARVAARWDLSPPAGGGDSYRGVARGTRAAIALEQGAHTGHRRQLSVEPADDPRGVVQALMDTVATWQGELPDLRVENDGRGRCEVAIPAALHTGHETHFAQVLDEFLRVIEARRWPADLVGRTLAKYTLLAEAAGAIARPG
jgi:predicted dehydrogenase